MAKPEAKADGKPGLWAFSTDIYERQGVADICLALQDKFGLDVNLLLYGCWRGERLSEPEMAAAMELVANWRDEIVRPLRRLRRLLKPGFPPIPENDLQVFRHRVAEVELEAERLQQQVLESAGADALAPNAASAAANLATYMRVSEVPLNDRTQALVVALLAAVFPEPS